MGEGCKQPNTYYVVGSGVYLFLWIFEVGMPSAKDYDPGAHLSVRLDSTGDPHVAQVNIKASKTDPFRKGVSLFLGRTGSVLCPVLALAA